MDIFFVPSNSMEELLFPGDVILINKLTYGPKLPQTPFEIPWFNIPFYFINQDKSKDQKQWWPYYRLTGYGCANKGDVIVYQLNDVYVTKRCVAVSGDRIDMINGKAFINNKQYLDPPTVKNEYLVVVNNDHKFYQKITNMKYCCIVRKDTLKHRFIGNFSFSTLAKIKRFTEVKSLHILLSHDNLESPIFVNPLTKAWTLDNMGPLIVPKKGMKILLTDKSFNIYKKVLTEFEKINIDKKNGKLFIRNTKTSSYVFKQNYFFVLGDNRKNSEDSRITGFVPETNIIGKVLYKL